MHSSQAVGPAFTHEEVPQLLFNSDHSKLAVFFEKTEVLMLFTIVMSPSGVTLTLVSETANIRSFAWSYMSTKYATIENKSIFITVIAM